LSLLRSVLEINRSQPGEIMRLIGRRLQSLRDVAVTVLGLAFKPDTDDVRESPAFPIIRALKAEGARLTAFDPVARPEAHEDLEGVTLAPSFRSAVAEAEVIVLVTRWAEFSSLAEVLRQLKRAPVVIDGRRVLDPASFDRYEGIGR
jgi:UDPglucose 6-dehydrogenase/GDP-mannose 6-dehydrogenase